MAMRRWLVIVGLMLCSAEGLTWGREGHETVGYIAAQLLRGSHAEQAIKNILQGDESLTYAATWLDCARSYEACHHALTAEQKHFTAANPSHHQYHFADIPFQIGQYRDSAIGADHDDVVHILTQAISVLHNKGGAVNNPHHFSQREALFLVAHLIGDIHQPLHAGSGYVDGQRFVVPVDAVMAEKTSTHGANLLMDGKHNLHGTWDVYLVRRAMRDHYLKNSFALAQFLLDGHYTPGKGKGDVAEWPAQWADESIQLAAAQFEAVRIHDRVATKDGHLGWTITLPRNYIKRATGQAEQQLLKAGYRLASVLQAIWP